MGQDYAQTQWIASIPGMGALGQSAAIEIMAQSQQSCATYGEECLAAIMRLGEGKAHKPQACQPKTRRQACAMRQRPAPKPNQPQNNGQHQAHFMDQRMQ